MVYMWIDIITFKFSELICQSIRTNQLLKFRNLPKITEINQASVFNIKKYSYKFINVFLYFSNMKTEKKEWKLKQLKQ